MTRNLQTISSTATLTSMLPNIQKMKSTSRGSKIRGKWAAYWGKPAPMDAEMEAKIATLGDYERCDCYETTIEIDVCREIAAKLADAVVAA